MAIVGDLLFFRRDQVALDDVMRHEVAVLRNKVDALPDNLFADKSDEEIAANVAKEHALQPLSIDLAAATPNVEETQVEVEDQFGFRRGPIRVAGLLATKSIPFLGNSNLWHLRPNPYDMNPPRGLVQGNQLVIGISVPAAQADEGARYIANTIARIPQYLQSQGAQISQHNASLSTHAIQWIKARRQRLGSAADLLKKLGG